VEVQQRWASRGVHLRLPPAACAEFDDPQPPTSNHFSNVFVYHERSKCVHNDDCLCYFDSPLTKMGKITLVLPAVSHDTLAFHSSMRSSGLRKTAQAPALFAAWVKETCDVWPFECMCSAHNGVLRVGANERLRQLLTDTTPKLDALAAFNAKAAQSSVCAKRREGSSEEERLEGAWSKDANDENCECG
jgi:hypothetical protein